MTKNFETLLLERDQGVLRVTLNRPELHNAFNEVMIVELTKVFSELSKDSETRVVVFTGAGESFCAGADLNWMKKVATYGPKQNIADAKRLHQMLLTIYQCPKPVLAHVNGAALGGGMGLVAAADMAFAEEGAKFGFTEVRLGLIPAVISPFVIRKIGEANAREYFLTGEKFSAGKAQEMGLIQYHCPSDLLAEKLNEKINSLKQGSPEALVECKRLIEKVSTLTLEKAGAYTSSAIAKRRASKEGEEGMLAFLTKRKPYWAS